MPPMRACHTVRRWAILGMAMALAACVEIAPGAGRQPTITLRPWKTPTSTPSPAVRLPTQQATLPPAPTPTPLTHIVERGETLLIIAAQYGVTLDALLALNPGLNPMLLSVGQPLLIPGPEGEPITSLLPTATPIPLTFSPVMCFPTATGGLMCLTAIRNPGDVTLEGLTANIELIDDEGEILASRLAYAPLNLLPPGASMPLGVYFEPPAPAAASAQASGVTAFPANEVEGRYLEVSIRRGTDARGRNGSSWIVSGEVVVAPTEVGRALRVQVLAMGLDAEGELVGFTIWESAETPGPGDSIPFTLQVVSLGRPIERVELSAEALAERTE
ncbi:MAG TPA: LysM domain-containing protein [Anaerolineales bacterium]|nr:LysM domain-containing protein [Anaerolineales bacterium]